MTSALVCAGCDVARPDSELLSLSCPNRGQDGADHVLRMQIDAEAIAAGWPTEPLQASDNAFVRYRKLSHTWHVAMQAGMSDAEYIVMTTELAGRLAEVDGKPLAITPLVHSNELATDIKNESVNISGSHKARHLIGTALHLQVTEALSGVRNEATLAIASCGNAALAAAVVARAADRALRVFMPPSAPASVVARLEALGADLVTCERRDGDPPGDPCYLRFAQAVADGALPFSCQGGDNALALVGGHTLGWEIIEQSREAPPTDVFVQVGGGALASSLMQAYHMAQAARIITALPRFHAVQTANAHPLVRAWRHLRATEQGLDYARHHRSEFMWPWETEPKSYAGGILDDETYDWFSIVSGLLASGGEAITVSEERLKEAHQRALSKTEIAVCSTGTAGFSGLLQVRSDEILPAHARPLVLFTGARR